MGNSENIIRFEEAMKNDPDKQKAYEEGRITGADFF